MSQRPDIDFLCLPWKDGGRTFAGVDCAGLVSLFLREQLGIELQTPATPASEEDKDALCERILAEADLGVSGDWQRGDVLFFRKKASGKLCHVAVCLGGKTLLHITQGTTSHTVEGLALLERAGLRAAGRVRGNDPRLAEALQNPALGDLVTIVLIAISIILSVVSAVLAPRAKRSNPKGRYADDGLITQSSPKLPLPIVMGRVSVAGNSPYTQLADRGQLITDDAGMHFNKVVVLAEGPINQVISDGRLQVNGTAFGDQYFKDGSFIDGIALDPQQTKAEAVSGSIAGDSNVPSLSIYTAQPAIEVPVDIRAHYDRTFPIYGFSGCAYVVLRAMNATKFKNPNVVATVEGVLCRTFTSSGFDVTTVTAESLSGADGSKVRFKLANADVIDVTSVEVNSTAYTEMSATNQSGNVYSVNRKKGYIEFPTAPASSATIEVDYTYHPRAWTNNPASLVVHLLTEIRRGMGFNESRIDWARAVEARDYYDETVFWQGTLVKRFVANYVVDYRKPAQDHLEALLAAAQSFLFISQGKFVIKPRRVGSVVKAFTTADLIIDEETGEPRSSFQATFADRIERANRIKVLFQNEDAFNAEDEAVADDERNQEQRADRLGNDGVVESNIKQEAVTTYSQAQRLAEATLAVSVGSDVSVRFKTNLKGLPLEPGDVISITHPAMPSWSAKQFWVEAIDQDSEDRLQLVCSAIVEHAEFS